MTTLDAMREVFEKAGQQFGMEFEEFHILRGKHDDEISEDPCDGDGDRGPGSGVRPGDSGSEVGD